MGTTPRLPVFPLLGKCEGSMRTCRASASREGRGYVGRQVPVRGREASNTRSHPSPFIRFVFSISYSSKK